MPARWPQLLLAASSLPMAALTAFAAWFLFFYMPTGEHGNEGGSLVWFAAVAYPLTLAMQVAACVGLYRQAKAGMDEPTRRTQGLIGLTFLSLAGPVLVFLAYALLSR